MKTTVILNTSEGSTIQIFTHRGMLSIQNKASNKLFVLFFVLICFFLTIIFLLAILYIIERNTLKCGQTKSENDDLCLTSSCIKTANYLLESIDESADPCENFYQFTCGNWMKKRRILSNANEQDVLGRMETELNEAIADLLSTPSSDKTIESKAITNARHLYSACMNESAIERENIDAILSLINTELGGWPILQGAIWNESSFNLSRLWLQLSQYNTFVFYQIEAKIDKKNTSKYLLKFAPSQLNLGYRGFYIKQSSVAKIYKQFMKDIVLLMTNDTSMIDTDIHDMFNFEKQIAQYHRINNDQYNSKQHFRTTIKHLSEMINTNFDFTGHIKSLYFLEKIHLNDDDTILIHDIDVIRNISLLLNHQSSRLLQNYMIWRFLIYRISNLPKRFQHIFNNLEKSVLGTSHDQSSMIKCASFVNSQMNFAISKLYLNKYYDKLAHDESKNMVFYIRKTFIHMINQSRWMDSLSKTRTIEKIEAILQHVGYPDYFDHENLTYLEHMYADYNFYSSHIQNVLLLLRLNTKTNLRKIREKISANEWIDYGPTTINAFYYPLYNKIVVPAGILRPPYFHKDAPKYLNYGAIGSTIGHEITHGFDEFRRHYDKNQKKSISWSNQTIEMFEKRSQCLIEQYNNYKFSQINMNVNGQRTRDENIADNDGLKKAFYAYKNWIDDHQIGEKKLPGLAKYTREQMFFIQFGQMWCSKMTDENAKDLILTDSHSPSQFRVNGPTSNFIEFDRAFQCQPGQGNSRVKKCSIW